ncbi:SDR family oxidoreductase [Mesorhizobium sp. WSM4306]|uniref:SDR family oxidoreductase n=1 Tax=Mesorhizobium sp. WSM4306 TaxID=2589885 RepID=UPI00115CF251|nr:SDR family oxidoreductase [Mesorhizobium sp. WSM4306]TRC97471.1 SDR family oxidoreductase [Mesorhizobium sp. WSM4306]
MSSQPMNIVLAHGAWADGSSWAKIIAPLKAKGFNLIAAPLPLTSFRDDVAALDRTIERVAGQVVLVGHAYAGAVIAATRSDKVKALVYVAALAPSDLAEPKAASAIVDQTTAAFGRIDALLNIAGAVPQIDLFDMTDEQWEGGLALKLHGARRLTIAAWPALKAAKGAVVLISGNSALFPKAPYAAVGTINAAIVALAKAFSDRGIADGVQVNSVLPGPVMTGRRQSYLKHWAPLHDMTVEEATASFPKEAGIARYGEPEEIAELMAFLVSSGARWMTGSALRMDGGEVKSV